MRLFRSSLIQPKLTVSNPGDPSEREADRVANDVMRMPEPQSGLAIQRLPGGVLHRGGADRGVQRLLKSRTIQAKLAVGPADDEYEREADRVAAQVMRMPDLTGGVAQRAPVRVQRKCLGCDEEEKLQRHPSQKMNTVDQPEVPSELESYLATNRGGGSPLSVSDRSFFEPRFGRNFGSVRVHTDTRGANTARSINSKAYTIGHDIVLGAGHSGSGTEPGRRLLAHELVHVVQQSGVSTGSRLGNPATSHGTGPRIATVRPSALRLQRQNIPSAVSWSGGGQVDPELVRLARDVRATQAGMSQKQFRRINVATARVLVDGKPRYLSAGNLRSGPHSEEWIDAQIGELKKGKHTVVLEELYSERVPCKGTCRPMLERKHRNAKIFFSTRKHGNAAAQDLMKQYGVSLPAKTPKPKGGASKGGGGKAPGSGKATTRSGKLKSGLRKAAKGLGRGVKAVGSGLSKALPVLGFLGTLAQISDALAAFSDAKGKISDLKRALDEMLAELDKIKDKRPPAPPAKVPAKQSVRVYDIFKRRLRQRTMDVPTSLLGTSYARISFSSLTDLDQYTTMVPPTQYDCAAVLRSGIGGLRQLYTFEGYSEISDEHRLRNIFPSQVKTIRMLCALVELVKQGSRRSTQTKPDGEEIAISLDWMVGDLSENMTASCQGAGGNWTCSSDGDLQSLTSATADLPDYQLFVELTRRAGGNESKWSYSRTRETPDPAANEQHEDAQGSVPQGYCDPGSYPNDSVLAYILQHYGSHCE